MKEARTFKFDDFNAQANIQSNLSENRDKCISFKKHAQLTYFGKRLIELCKTNKIERVFDVGCGLVI